MWNDRTPAGNSKALLNQTAIGQVAGLKVAKILEFFITLPLA
jgi:hypothetical protein